MKKIKLLSNTALFGGHRIGEVIEVADGYAENFIKCGRAELVTEDVFQLADLSDENESRKVTIEKINELCVAAGVNPDNLVFENKNPTLTQVKKAIKSAKNGDAK